MNENNIHWVDLTKAEKKEIKREVKEILKEKEKTQIASLKILMTKEEKILSFFEKIKFLWLSDLQKEEVAKKVKDDSAGDKLYWMEIILSSIIATLWLLQNSVAVVIGAMLIAPLLRPINGLSYSIARWGQKFFLQSLKVLIYSIILSIAMGYFVTSISGLDIETQEILARVHPNVLDFFIAIFSAMVAVMSLRFVRLGESIAWVAMAAALMPPLAVIWIEIAMWNYSASFGAIMLFWANLSAILLVAVIFFWLYWFTPHDSRLQHHAFQRILWVIGLIFILLVPLFISFHSIKLNHDVSNQARWYLENAFISSGILYSIADIKILHNSSQQTTISIVLKIPEDADINKLLRNIQNDFSQQLWKQVIFDIELIRSVQIKL